VLHTAGSRANRLAPSSLSTPTPSTDSMASPRGLLSLRFDSSPRLLSLSLTAVVPPQEVSLWPHWVVVFGFNPHADRDSPSSLQNILRLLQEFGEIDDYSPGAGNWLFIRSALSLPPSDALPPPDPPSLSLSLSFVSSHDADRVLSLDNTFLTAHLMIGVRKLNQKMAREMNLSVRSDGRLSQGEGGLLNRESLAGAAYRRELDPDFESIMRPPQRSKDICTRLFEYFMAY
jgi:hypothetical protein